MGLAAGIHSEQICHNIVSTNSEKEALILPIEATLPSTSADAHGSVLLYLKEIAMLKTMRL